MRQKTAQARPTHTHLCPEMLPGTGGDQHGELVPAATCCQGPEPVAGMPPVFGWLHPKGCGQWLSVRVGIGDDLVQQLPQPGKLWEHRTSPPLL